MQRALALFSIAILATAVPAAAQPDDQSASFYMTDRRDCAFVGGGSTEAREARADLYVTKIWGGAVDPTSPSFIVDMVANTNRHADEFGAAVLQALQEDPDVHPASNSHMRVQIEVVAPANQDPHVSGVMVILEVDLTACLGL